MVVDATDASGRCHDQGTLGDRRRAAGRARDHRRDRSGGAERDRPHVARRRGAHGEHRPEAPAHRVRVELGRRATTTRRAEREREHRRAAAGHDERIDGIEVVDLSSCMNFPEGADAPASSTPASRRSTATAGRTRTSRSSSTFRDRLGLPRARDLSRRPAHLRGDRRHAAVRPIGRVRRQRHADRLHRRQAARHAAAVRAPRELDGRCPVRAPARSVDRLRQRQTDGDPRACAWPSGCKIGPRPSLEGVEQLGTVHHMGFEDQQQQNVEPAVPATRGHLRRRTRPS